MTEDWMKKMAELEDGQEISAGELARQLDNLAASLVNDILETPDEELINELIEDGVSVQEYAEKGRMIFERARESIGVNRERNS
jgi:rRNA-processing protein FCF1